MPSKSTRTTSATSAERAAARAMKPGKAKGFGPKLSSASAADRAERRRSHKRKEPY